MGSIMRVPDPNNSVIIPLNDRVLQENDCIVVICPDDSAKNALSVYKNGDWVEICGPQYDYSTTPSMDSLNVFISYTVVPHYFYACFLPSPVSS